METRFRSAPALEKLLMVLFPLPEFVSDSSVAAVARTLAADVETMGALAPLLAAIARRTEELLGSGWPPWLDAFRSIEDEVARHLAMEPSAALRNAIHAIYCEIARHPSVFEARFRRRLTEGNESCPYWATYATRVRG